MKTKYTYILFVFATHDDPDSFVSIIGEEISLISMSPDVRYFYGPQASVFTFSSESKFEDLSEFFKIMLGDDKLSFIFLPLDKDKMCSGFGEDVDKHLFGLTPLAIIPTNITKINKIREELENLESEDEYDDDDEIERIRTRGNEPSVNDILDKIRIMGIKALTNQEKNILDNYSKQL